MKAISLVFALLFSLGEAFLLSAPLSQPFLSGRITRPHRCQCASSSSSSLGVLRRQCTYKTTVVVDRLSLSARAAFRITRPLHLAAASDGAAAASEGDDDPFAVEAEDLEALQKLFAKYCDQEGLMTKEAVQKIPTIAELLVGCGWLID